MAKEKTKIIPFNLQLFAEGEGGEGNPNGGEGNSDVGTNGSGDPKDKKWAAEEIEKEVEKRAKAKEEELKQQIRKELENEKNLSDSEKFELEKQKFAQDKEKWQKKVEQQTISLNTEKIKSIYLKEGYPNELVDVLVGKIGLEYSVEEQNAKNIIDNINKYIETKTKDLKQALQNNQPNAQSGNSDTNNGGSPKKENKAELSQFFK